MNGCKSKASKFIIITTIISIAFLTISVSKSSIIFAQDAENKYISSLSGDNEVPPVKTNASGSVWFKTNSDNIMYSINVTNIQDVTAAHIHSGIEGENGPVVVTLYKSENAGKTPEELASGNITADMLEGPMTGKQISDLVTAMQNGETYVNVHTKQNPDGEIRGQLSNEEPQYGGGSTL